MRNSKSQPELRLTGTYVGIEARRNCRKELIKTHFRLGDSKADFGTTHKGTFQAGDVRAVTAEHDPGHRATHFALGDDPKSMGVETEHLWRFKRYNSKPERLNAEVQKDLTMHHFELGSHAKEFSSTTNSTFTPQLQPSDPKQLQDIERSKQNIRKHNYEFGSETGPTISITKSDYTPKKTQGWSKDPALQDRVKDLRSSHFKQGVDMPDYNSTHSLHFTGKPGLPATLSKAEKDDLRKQHFELGTDAPTLASQTQDVYANKGVAKPDFNEDAMKDLRKTHFKLGHDKGMYVPTSTDHKLLRPGVYTAPTRDGMLRKTHFMLGNDPAKWKTSYGVATNSTGGACAVPFRSRDSDKASHFSMGTDPAVTQTVAASDYQPHSLGSRGTLDPAVVTNMRNHHYVAGPGDREFKPMSTEYGSTTGAPGSMDPKALKFLRGTHFAFGHDPSDFGTSTGSLGQRTGSASKLDPAMLKDLRSHHSNLGSGNMDLKTTYRGAYNWVQPIADRNYHCSFHRMPAKPGEQAAG